LACTDFSYELRDASLFELVPSKGNRVQDAGPASSRPVETATLSGRTSPVEIEFRLAEATAGDGLTERRLVGRQIAAD